MVVVRAKLEVCERRREIWDWLVELLAKTEVGERGGKRGNGKVEWIAKREVSERMWQRIDCMVRIQVKVSKRGRERRKGFNK